MNRGIVTYISGFTFLILAAVLFTGGNYVSVAGQGASPTFTEAPGGLYAGFVLRCPKNLSGIGPTWRTITIGKSTVDDLLLLYKPYGDVGKISTPLPSDYDFRQNLSYAETYQISISWQHFRAELGLPEFVFACVVNNRIQAMVISTERMTEAPKTIEQLISLMGRPDAISWQEIDQHMRILHWFRAGTSAEVWNGIVVIFMHFYPFQSSNYQEKWPANSLLRTPPAGPVYQYETLDAFDLPSIEATLTISPAWATRTPYHFEVTPTPNNFN